MQAGLRFATAKYPHIQIIGCKSHTLNLLCKDSLKISSANKLVGQVKFIINKIKKSHRLHSIFLQKQKEKNIKVALKIPPETRWVYVEQTLDCLIKNNSVLMIMAIDAEADIDETDDTDPLNVPGEVKKLILGDRFCQNINSLHDILQPIVASLTKIETDDLVIHNANEILGKMFTSVDGLIQSSAFDARDKKQPQNICKTEKNQS